MYQIFPESMNKINYDDTVKAIHQLEEYLKYVTERCDYAINNISRKAAEGGNISLVVGEKIEALEQSVGSLGSQLAIVNGKASAAQQGVDSLQDSVNDISSTIGEIVVTLASLMTRVTNLETNYSDLEERVRALEGR